MRAGLILSVYRLKVKAFFGAVRASKASVAFMLFYILSFLPSIIGFSMAVAEAVKSGGAEIGLYIEFLAAATSFLMSIAILLSLRGYTVPEYEQNLIFTSPIKPREFLVAGLLANLTCLLLFLTPLIFLYILVILSLNLSFYSALLILFASILFAFTLFFTKTFLSVLRSLYGGFWLPLLMAVIVFLLLVPTLGSFTALPLKYSEVPYPSTFLAKTLIGIIFHETSHISDLLGLISYFTLSLILFALTSKRNFFPLTRQVAVVSPFDISIQAQTMKVEKSIRTFSKMSTIFKLSIDSNSLHGLLIRKEIIRMMREGSLFAIILLYVVVLLIAIFTIKGPASGGTQGPSAPSIVLVLLVSIYSLVIPLMLAGNWNLSDSKNLWIPFSSGADMRLIARATLYSFILVSTAVPCVILLPISIFLGVNPLLILALIISASFVGCSVNLYVSIRFLRGGRGGAMPLLVGWISMLLSSIFMAPAYILAALSISETLLTMFFFAALLAYSAIIMRIFLKLIERSMSSMEV